MKNQIHFDCERQRPEYPLFHGLEYHRIMGSSVGTASTQNLQLDGNDRSQHGKIYSPRYYCEDVVEHSEGQLR